MFLANFFFTVLLVQTCWKIINFRFFDTHTRVTKLGWFEENKFRYVNNSHQFVAILLDYTKNVKYQTISNSCLDTLAFEIVEAYSDLTFSQPLPSIYGQMNRNEMLTGNVEYHLRFCLHLSDAKQGILYDFSSTMTHQVLKYIATLRSCVSEKREMQNMLTYTLHTQK